MMSWKSSSGVQEVEDTSNFVFPEMIDSAWALVSGNVVRNFLHSDAVMGWK